MVLVQKKKWKIDFQYGCHGGHLGFPIGTILLFFIYKSPWCFLPSFESIGLSVQEKKWKTDFQDGHYGSHLAFRWNYFSYFWSTSHPDDSYKVSSLLAFRFRRRSKKQIFKMATMAATLDFLSKRFSLFLIYKSRWCFLPSFESVGFSIQEKKWKIDFQDGGHGGHLGFPIGTILAIFDLQVTLMLPTNFRVLAFGEEAKNRFSRWPPWWPSWISYLTILAIFWSTSYPDAFYQVSMGPSWISDRNDFSCFWSTSCPDASYQVSSQMAQGCRRSRLKQLHDRRWTTHDGHWLTAIAHLEQFMLRWAKKEGFDCVGV